MTTILGNMIEFYDLPPRFILEELVDESDAILSILLRFLIVSNFVDNIRNFERQLALYKVRTCK